jgi:ribosomal protein L7/L12
MPVQVTCVDKGLEDHLTVGKVYEVLELIESVPEGNTDYVLVGDDNEVDRFMVELFRPVDKIALIRFVRQQRGWTLAEAKDFLLKAEGTDPATHGEEMARLVEQVFAEVPPDLQFVTYDGMATIKDGKQHGSVRP